MAVSAAKNLTPYTLELGGKSPAIIDRNTDLKLVSKKNCMGKVFKFWSDLCRT